MNQKRWSRRTLVGGGIAATLLAGASMAGLAATSGTLRGASTAPNGQCTAPALDGAVVDVKLTNMMDGGMMGRGNSGGTMRLVTSTGQVAAGTVSFRAVNAGTLAHELVVLPLGAGQTVGHRVATSEGRVDEAGSLGEVSNTCASGAGTGLAAGTIGWVTVTLPPGRYELVCNLPGHYDAGMYAELTVS